MEITRTTLVADLAASEPATIKVFQKNHIDFCCGGKIPLADACAREGVDLDDLVAELRAVSASDDNAPADWQKAPLHTLIAHIQRRYHETLRAELPRLSQMLAKVVSRHGDRLPETLLPLQQTFEHLSDEMFDHMRKEDQVLFPAIVGLESSTDTAGTPSIGIDGPIEMMEHEHEQAGAALARIRELTRGYAPPEDACPTFRGLYYGLAELESDMHVHVHLENNILFPRAARLTRQLTR